MAGEQWLFVATALVGTAAAVGLPSLLREKNRAHPWIFPLLFSGFLFECLFLYQEGKARGHCPILNLAEVFSFLAWSLLLTYLVIGPVYRVSVLGLFTAPVVTILNLLALALPLDRPTPVPKMGPALEFHATLALLAYGVLGLAAVASFLFLLQEYELKRYRLGLWLFRLPALGELVVVQQRLLLFGFFLLSLGIALGILLSGKGPWDWVKITWSVLIWLLYLFVILSPRLARWSSHQTALASLASYLFLLFTFWGINSLSQAHRFQ
jgi:ABC-type uncharacterized transport system permease subunit